MEQAQTPCARPSAAPEPEDPSPHGASGVSSISARLADWWSAWQLVAYLAAALGLSLYANYWQWKRAVTADLRQDNKALTETLDAVNVIAKQAAIDGKANLDALAKIAERGRTTRIVYRQAAVADPLPAQCAPGQARMDAVNSGIPRPKGQAPGEVR